METVVDWRCLLHQGLEQKKLFHSGSSINFYIKCFNPLKVNWVAIRISSRQFLSPSGSLGLICFVTLINEKSQNNY